MPKKKSYKCKLFPYECENILSIQEAKQKSGWQISAFSLPKAWDKTQGEGVVIAVIDTGCDLTHPDLIRNLLPGVNLIQPGKEPIDDNNHGTHSIGIICAENNDIGVVGVAPKCKVIPIKAMDSKGNGNLEAVCKGIKLAIDRNADIICLSIGCPNPLGQLRKIIQSAVKKGIPVICAAGNAGNSKDIYYPAAYPETIAVGSIDEDFDRSDFSCTGHNLDFMAPGGKILSTVPKDWYAILSGTSMAAPFVAGLCALLLSYSRKSGNIKLASVNDYRKLFRQYSIPISNKQYAGDGFFQGFGIIDPRKFMEWIEKNRPKA